MTPAPDRDDNPSSRPVGLGMSTRRRLLRILGVFVSVAAVTSFIGWAGDIPRLTDWDGDGISIQPNATVASAAAGIALLILAARRRTAAALLGSFIALVGAATLFEWVTGINLGIDTIFLFGREWGRRGVIYLGRMGPPGTVSWTLIGVAFVCLRGGTRPRQIAAMLGVGVTAIASLSLIGYLYGADRLFSLPTVTVIAMQTATMILATGIGLLIAASDEQPLRTLAENTAAGLLARRMLVPILIIPGAIGYGVLMGLTAGLYDPAMGIALLVLILMASLCLVVWWGTRATQAFESRYQTLVSITTDVPWTSDERGAFTQYQAAWADYTGQAWEQMRGFGWADAFHPDDREHILAGWHQAVAAGLPYASDGRVWHRGAAEYRHFKARASPLRNPAGEVREYVGTCTDIHLTRQAELAAEESNRRLAASVRELEAVFRAAPVGIGIARDPLCERIDVNATFAAMLGVAAGTNASLTGPDATGLPFRVTTEDGSALPYSDLPLQFSARTGESSLEQALRIDGPSGVRIISGSAVPLLDPGGRPQGAIAVFHDVTAQRQASAEREALLAATRVSQREAERANRAKDEFLAVLSHELRSPLSAMLGWVQIIKRPGIDQSLIDRAIDTFERNLRTQGQIINDLLDLSRITSGKFEMDAERVDLTAVVLTAVDSLRPMFEGKAIALELSVPDTPQYVDGDAGRLQQAITNVMHNAIKFTGEGGHIGVCVRNASGFFEVEVVDNGQGIGADVLPLVFDRFVQAESSATSRRHGGLGLGLAIVKQLVERHGGSVSAHSDGPGRGARFILSLPASARSAPPVIVPTVPSWYGQGSTIEGLSVLVVEDNEDSRTVLCLALEQSGASVQSTSSVAEALAVYTAARPDVLISDIGMPDQDGYMLIRAIRDREEGTGVRTLALALSGFASRLDYDAALRAGFDDHLGKPVDFEMLLERLQILLASRPARA